MSRREVDFLVAEKILGIPCECPRSSGMLCRVHDCALYSRDMGAAWIVVEILLQHWCDFSLEASGANWTATCAVATATAESPALAVCLCGLEAFKTHQSRDR
jgi:hypothetical protein